MAKDVSERLKSEAYGTILKGVRDFQTTLEVLTIEKVTRSDEITKFLRKTLTYLRKVKKEGTMIEKDTFFKMDEELNRLVVCARAKLKC